MAKKSSRNDPAMIAAEVELRRLLKIVSEDVLVAIDAFEEHPRCLVGQDCGRYPPGYPGEFMLSQYVDDKVKSATDKWRGAFMKAPTDLVSGIAYHNALQCALSRYYGTGLEPSEYRIKELNGKTETPAQYMDRARGILRYAERIDRPNTLMKCFALLKVQPTGPWLEEIPGGAKYRQFEYVTIPITDQSVHPQLAATVMNVSASIRKAFDLAAIALLPRDPSQKDLEFLKWIVDRGGKARGFEVRKWLADKGYASGGQDPAAPFLRKYCDKEGAARSQVPWIVRPEALTLIGRKP